MGRGRSSRTPPPDFKSRVRKYNDFLKTGDIRGYSKELTREKSSVKVKEPLSIRGDLLNRRDTLLKKTNLSRRAIEIGDLKSRRTLSKRSISRKSSIREISKEKPYGNTMSTRRTMRLSKDLARGSGATERIVIDDLGARGEVWNKERMTPGRLANNTTPRRRTTAYGSRRAVTPNLLRTSSYKKIEPKRGVTPVKSNLNNMRTTTMRKTVIKDDWSTPLSRRGTSKDLTLRSINPFMTNTSSKRKIITPQRNRNTIGITTTPLKRSMTPILQKPKIYSTVDNSLQASLNTFETLKKSRIQTPTRRHTHRTNLPERRTHLLEPVPTLPARPEVTVDPAPPPVAFQQKLKDSNKFAYGAYKKAYIERIANLDYDGRHSEGYGNYLKEVENQVTMARILKQTMKSQPFRGAVDVPFTSMSKEIVNKISWEVAAFGFG